jgi:hypothetical protein
MPGPTYTPVSPDAPAVAQHQRDLIVGIIATDPNFPPPKPTLPPPPTPYEVAALDIVLMSRGVQLRDVLPLGVLNDSSAMGKTPAFSDSPFGTVSFTPPITKTYWLETRLSMWVADAAGLVQFRLLVGSQSIDDAEASYFFNATGDHRRVDFTIPVALTGGQAVKIRWQWIGGSGQTLHADGNDFRALRVWG